MPLVVPADGVEQEGELRLEGLEIWQRDRPRALELSPQTGNRVDEGITDSHRADRIGGTAFTIKVALPGSPHTCLRSAVSIHRPGSARTSKAGKHSVDRDQLTHIQFGSTADAAVK